MPTLQELGHNTVFLLPNGLTGPQRMDPKVVAVIVEDALPFAVDIHALPECGKHGGVKPVAI